MRISQNGINFIKQFEGLVLHSYNDGFNNWTIGYGHCTGDVKPGQTITEQQAEVLLKEDLEWAEANVNKYVPIYKFNQNQFDALVSFCFNIGSIDELTHEGSCSIEEIKSRIPLYCHAGGEVVEGLQRRRSEELKLFNTPCSINKDISYYFEKVANTLLGMYGNDEARKQALGADYDIVQDVINNLYEYLIKEVK